MLTLFVSDIILARKTTFVLTALCYLDQRSECLIFQRVALLLHMIIRLNISNDLMYSLTLSLLLHFIRQIPKKSLHLRQIGERKREQLVPFFHSYKSL